MKVSLILLLLLRSLLAWGADGPYSDEAWLREGLARQIPKFKRMTVVPMPDDKGIVAANCETDLSWRGDLRVFHCTDDRIDWMARFPAFYAENCGHYVLSCDWIYLEKLEIRVLEVFDSTHMGNGSFWLFALEGHDLRLLLHTTARGRFLQPPPDLIVPQLGDTHLEEDHLRVEYRVPQKGTGEAVFLTGIMAAYDGEGKKVATKPFAETWNWDDGKRVFVRAQP